MTRMLTLPLFTLHALIAFVFTAMLLLPAESMGQQFAPLEDVSSLSLNPMRSNYQSLIDDTNSTQCSISKCDGEKCSSSECLSKSSCADLVTDRNFVANPDFDMLTSQEIDEVETCPFCEEKSCRETSRTKRSRDIGKMLQSALEGKSLNDPAAVKAIEAALSLSAQLSEADANAELNRMQGKHELEMSLVHERISSLNTQDDASVEMRKWLGPLYENQNRLSQQILNLETMVGYPQRQSDRQLSSESTRLHNRHNRIEDQEMERQKQQELFQLQMNLEQLRQEIARMKNTDVQRANYLRPVFDQDRRLQPIPDPGSIQNRKIPNDHYRR